MDVVHISLPARAALIYLLGASAWILISDQLLLALFGSSPLFTWFQSVKGGVFVVVTSLLLYVALVAGERRRAQLETARLQEANRARLLADFARDMIYHYSFVEPRGFVYVSPAVTPVTGYTPEEHYADPDLGFKLVLEEDRPLLETAARRPEEPIVLRWRRKDGTVIWTEQRNRQLYGPDGALVGMEGIARDITAHKDTAARLARALEAERLARLAAEGAGGRTARLQAVSAAFAGALTSAQVVEVITLHGAEATGAASVVVLSVDPAGETLEVIGSSGRHNAGLLHFKHLPISSSLPPATAVRTREPLWLPSPEAAVAHAPALGELFDAFQAQALACLPLIAAGQVIGAVGFSFAERREFSAEDQAFLLALAQQCASVLERTRLYAEVHDGHARLRQLSQLLLKAQEQERRRIARELHDEVGQILGALKINLHLLRPHTAPGALLRLDESDTMLDGLIEQVRALSLDLRPSVLDDLGLAAALEWYGERLGRRSGLEVSVSSSLGKQAVSPEIATTCFRVAQEALTNVVRHAQARRVSVHLGLSDEMLTLSIYDDGVGFDVAAGQARASGGSSLGLISMVERAELVGGWADISSSPGGTEVWACFPLARAGATEVGT